MITEIPRRVTGVFPKRDPDHVSLLLWSRGRSGERSKQAEVFGKAPLRGARSIAAAQPSTVPRKPLLLRGALDAPGTSQRWPDRSACSRARQNRDATTNVDKSTTIPTRISLARLSVRTVPVVVFPVTL